jgi:ABC-2 type transport system permease protein
MTMRYLRIYGMLMRNSMIREMSFKANFLLWTVVELMWFSGQVLFVDVLFSHVDRVGDWSKWQMVALISTHQIIAQLFQAFFYINVTNLPELVRTGKLDTYLTLPVDAQFTVSTKQFGLDNLGNALIGCSILLYSIKHLGVTPNIAQIGLYLTAVILGVCIHYSVMFSLSTLCFWIIRAQGLVYGYFNLFNIGRYPDTVYKGAFRAFFSWIIPVIIVANIPARVITRTADSAAMGMLQMTAATMLALIFCRLIWLQGLKRYASASS